MTPVERRLLQTLLKRPDHALPLHWFNKRTLQRGARPLSRRGYVNILDDAVRLTAAGLIIARSRADGGNNKTD
jgi:hypothetical protein